MITLSPSVNGPSKRSFTLSIVFCNVSFFGTFGFALSAYGTRSTSFLLRTIAPLKVSVSDTYSSFILLSTSLNGCFALGNYFNKLEINTYSLNNSSSCRRTSYVMYAYALTNLCTDIRALNFASSVSRSRCRSTIGFKMPDSLPNAAASCFSLHTRLRRERIRTAFTPLSRLSTHIERKSGSSNPV